MGSGLGQLARVSPCLLMCRNAVVIILIVKLDDFFVLQKLFISISNLCIISQGKYLVSYLRAT